MDSAALVSALNLRETREERDGPAHSAASRAVHAAAAHRSGPR